MVYSNSQILKFLFITVAIAMVLCVGRFSVKATSDSPRVSNRQVPADANVVLFRRGAIDTNVRTDLDSSMRDLRAVEGSITTLSRKTQQQTRVIQFNGAIKREWLERIKTTGAQIIGYVPNNAYLIRGDATALAQIASLDAGSQSDDARPIRWMSEIQAIQKIAPELDTQLIGDTGATATIDIELLDCPEAEAAIETIQSIAVKANSSALTRPSDNKTQKRFLHYIVLSLDVPVAEIEGIAALDEVLFISPAQKMKLQDERSMQILAGNLSADKTRPSGTGYMNWLTSTGLDFTGDFIVDFADSGIDRSSLLDTLIHPDLLDTIGHSRLMYSQNYAVGKEDKRGHGTLVASIAAGSGASNRADSENYLYGLGVDPKAKIGASRIFSDDGSQPSDLRFTTAVSNAYAAGARISNNSWGNSSNNYDVAAQEYDGLVRDAQPAVAGNQEMVIVFSAGNSSAGGRISSPGTAKNVITVAGSENYRPQGEDFCNLDGLGGIGPEGANNAMDILRFSSGGPTSDGRAKPDITAPGTHIYGAASQSSGFFALGLCPGVPIYQPPGQSLFTWSSGTSLAAPHVTGAAALVRKFFTQHSLLGGGAPPSPAMTKAFLVNSALYMTGEGTGGNLPQERQGWGLVNLTQAFKVEHRRFIDQSQLFTESGQVYELQGAIADRSQPLRVTLVWTDAPGSLIGAALVNNLDLEIKVGSTTIYRGNNFVEQYSVTDGQADVLNNVESIVIKPELIPTGQTGNLTITVRATNIAGNGVPNNANDLDQDFALVVTNITDPDIPPPPPKKPAITNVTYVKKVLTITGKDFTAAARVEINGQIIDMPFVFDAATNSFSIKMKAKKLKLVSDTNNQIILIEGSERSQPFTIRV